MIRAWSMLGVLVAAAAAACPARAEYGEECRALAQQLAEDPGALKMGELDIVKNCVSGLQRGILLKEPPPAKGVLAACASAAAEKPVPAPACPVCPTAEKLCPRREAPPPPVVREKAREPAEDRRLKPNYPKF